MHDSDVVSCNGKQIAHHRKTLGWTQSDLAKRAGYSERAIRNAEKGTPIRYSTVLSIANAIREGGTPITAADFCIDPAEMARAFCEAYRVHEAEMAKHVEHLVSSDLETFIAGDPAIIPFAGTYHGLEGLHEFWQRFFALIERVDKDYLNLDYFVCKNEVVAYGRERGRIIGHSTDEPTWLCLKFTIEEGRIKKFEDYFDTQAAHAHIDQFRVKQDKVLDEG